MRERHPIDDIFRRGLAAAEQEPPAAIWEGVMRQRAGRRRLLVIWRRIRWIGPLALMVGAPALWWALSEAPTPPIPTPVQASAAHAGAPDAPAGPNMTHPGSPAHEATTPAAEQTPDAAPTVRSATHTLSPVPGKEPASRGDRARRSTARQGSDLAGTAHLNPGDGEGSSGARTVHERERTSSTSAFGGSVRGAVIAAEGPTAGDAQWLSGRRSAFVHGVPVSAPIARGVPDSYVLPRADWWVAVMAGRFDRTRRWQGTDPELVGARAAVEGHAGEWHLGLWAGRRWRSGSWFGVGIEHTGGRSAYERSDRSQQLNAFVNTSIAVFENTVLATQSDTLFVVRERSETTAITGRSSTWRVPLLLGWEGGVRRWMFGAHLGLALEWQRMRDGYLFLEEVTEGGAVVQRAERVRDADRSFGLVSAQLALDGGFQLTEHVRIIAGPVYQTGLGMVFGQGAVQALPTRLGAQLRLRVDLPHRQR